MFRRILLGSVAGVLLALMIVPVSAAPSLSIGSTASYTLAGQITASQTCSTDQVQYLAQACYGAIYIPPQTFTVSILDDSQCHSVYYSNSSLCRFYPTSVTVPQGSTVTWTNTGNVTHSVVSNQTTNGVPLFTSGLIQPKGTFSYLFDNIGQYDYYDSIHGGAYLGGFVSVTSNTYSYSPPTPTSVQVGLAGTIGWKVEGLSSTQANLLVSHSTSVSVSPIILVSFTPVKESGSFEQSVNLSTRVESPGTATSLVMSVLSSYLPFVLGYGSSYGYYGQLYQTMRTSSANDAEYTQWWVNGPLSLGSPVQILQGWASVTGSEALDLGGTVGTRQAWIVTSQASQTFNLSIPNTNTPLGPSSTSTAKASLDLSWSFDKSADLLLRNNDTLTISTHSVSPTTIYPYGCYQYGCGSPVTVNVTHDMTATVSLTVQLSSTSLSQFSSIVQTPPLNTLAGMSWMSIGIAGLAAGVVSGLALWLGRRARHAAMPSPIPVPLPATSSTDS